MVKEIELLLQDLSADRTFAFSTRTDLGALLRSIQAIGQLTPALVREQAGSYQLVHGWRRVEALRALQIERVIARVFAAKELTDRQAFDLGFWDNASTRSFNLLEAGRVATFLAKRLLLPEPEIIERYLPALNLPPAKKILDRLLQIQELEPEWQELFASPGFPLGQTQTLLRFSAPDRQSLFPLIAKLRPGANKLREMLTLILEIASRERRPAEELLQQPALAEVCDHPRLSRPQKVEALLDALRWLRHPRLAQARLRFDQAASRLSLPEGIRLSPATSFEDPTVALNFRFSNSEELRRAGKALQRAADTKDLSDLLEPG